MDLLIFYFGANEINKVKTLRFEQTKHFYLKSNIGFFKNEHSFTSFADKQIK